MSTITEKLKWLVEADATSAIKGFDAAGKAADQNLTLAEDKSKKLGGTLTKVGAGAMATSGIIGGALVKAAGAFEDLALKAGQMADATGLTVDQASRWIEVSGDMGIGADTIESALGKMNKTLGNSPGKFEELGIKVATTKGGIEDVNGTFLNVIDRLNQIEDPAARAAAAAEIFGKGWQGAAELLTLNTDDIKTQLQSVSDQKVINDDELGKAKDYRASLDALKDSAENLALSIGGSAAPVIGAVADALGSAVGGFTRLDTATGGAIGKFAAIATIGLGVVGTLSLVAGQAIKMRDRFTTLGDDGVRSLTNMGKAAQGVTVAVGVLGVALTGLEIANTLTQDTQGATDAMNEFINDSGHIVDVKTHTKELLDNWQKLSEKVDDSKGIFDRTLGDLPHAFDQSGENLAHLQAGFDKLLATSPQLAEETVAALEATKAAADAGDTAAQHWLDKNSLSAGVIADLRAKVDDAAGATDVLTGKLEDNTAAGAESEAVVRSSTNAVDGYSYAAKDAKDTTDRLAAATEEAKRKSDAFATSLQNQRDKIDDLRSSARSAVDDQFAFRDATDEAKTKVDEMVDTLKHHKAASDESKAAIDAAKDAALDASAKYATLNGAAIDSAGGIQRQIDSLVKQRDALAPDSPLRLYLQEYIDALNLIPSKIDTDLNLHVSSNATNPGAPGYIPRGGGGIQHAAEGGIVKAKPGGQLIVAGEAGSDEALVPLDGQHGLSGGGVTIQSLTINMPPGADGNAIVRELKKFERRNGPGWRAS